MSVSIAGMGWVTPLGSGVDDVWAKLERGEEGLIEQMPGSDGRKSYPALRVPSSALKELPVHPRLRRAGAVSRFAAAAGLAAWREAEIKIGPIDPSRLALIFAISNGGVTYTRRFYHDIVTSGAGAASPLLFPETVFNAPASHLAALLGVTGITYTLVGDGAVGLSAVQMAQDLINNGETDHCLVVGAEEADWLLCDAYARWRLLRWKGPIEPFANPPRGMVLSEGAGALFLTRDEAGLRIEASPAGAFYNNRRQLAEVAESLLRQIQASSASFIVTSANGTFIDAAEGEAIKRVMTRAQIYTAKPALGESVGAGGIWQTIIAAKVLSARRLPPLLRAPLDPSFPSRNSAGQPVSAGEAIVLTCGLNQQVTALRVAI